MFTYNGERFRMFTYNGETKESLGIYSERLEELKNIALNSKNENEL